MFCTKCGAQLPDDSSFCTNCGTPVASADAPHGGPDDATTVIGAVGVGGPDDRTQALSALGDDPNPWSGDMASQRQAPKNAWQDRYGQGNTHPATPYQMERTEQFATMPEANQPSVPQAVAQYAGDGSSGTQGGSSLPMAIVAIIAIAAVAVVLYLFVLAPKLHLPTLPFMQSDAASASLATSDAASSGASATTDDDQAHSATASTSSTASAATGGAEAQIASDLTTYYNKLDGYDSDIKDVASAFNADYLKDSMSTRQADRDQAADVSNRLHSELTAVRALTVPSSSPHYQTYQDIVTCYDDLCHRVDVIVESWDISLQYSSPSGHADEITAPITRDNDANDKNVYKSDFDDRYPRCRP